MIKPKNPNLEVYAEHSSKWVGWSTCMMAVVQNSYVDTIPPTADVYVPRWQTSYSRVPVMSMGGFYWVPQKTDTVLLVFVDGRKDAPYIVGELLNPTTGKQLSDSKQLLIQSPAGIKIICNPDGSAVIQNPAGGQFKMNADGTGTATFPGALTINAASVALAGGGAAVARIGDTVQVNVAGTLYNGTITSGSSKVSSG